MLSKLGLKSEFVKYVMVLMSGTIIAQLFGYALAPIITRLYTPEQSAELGLFFRIVSVGAAFATARYEHALPIIKNDNHSFRMYLVAIRIALYALVISSFIVIVPALLSKSIADFLFFALMPLALLGLVFTNTGVNWAIRNKKFKIISYSRITSSLFGNGLKVVFGWLNTGYIGLILGMVIGLLLSVFWFVRDYFITKKETGLRVNSPKSYVLAKEYKEFPKVNLPHVLMDLSKDLILATVLILLYSKTDFGLFDHSYKMLRLPIVFAGAAIGQVFYQKCAENFNNGIDNLPIILKAIKKIGRAHV